MLAMVISIVMTIASKKMTIVATPKTGLIGAENSGKKGAEHPLFIKGYCFYTPRDARKRPR